MSAERRVHPPFGKEDVAGALNLLQQLQALGLDIPSIVSQLGGNGGKREAAPKNLPGDKPGLAQAAGSGGKKIESEKGAQES